MKKFLSVCVTVLCLLFAVGCGAEKVMGQEGSLYPYGWSQNSDGTIDFVIEGKWDKDCHWSAEYDQEALTCTPLGRKGNKFKIGSLEARTAEIDFRLYREGTEPWEYDLWLCVQGNGSGGVIVLADTHAEPVAEGSYSYITKEDGSVEFRIHTAHQWASRLVNRKLRAETLTWGDGEYVYEIEAAGACAGTVELYDTQADRLLAVQVSADKDGTVTVENVEERQDTAFSRESINTLWEQLGVTFPLDLKITVKNCSITDDEEVSVLPCGEMEVIIDDNEYSYLVTMSDEWVEAYLPAGDDDPDAELKEPTQEDGPATEVTEMEIGGVPVTIYTRGKSSCAVWKQYGANFILDGRSEASVLRQAVQTILGGQS